MKFTVIGAGNTGHAVTAYLMDKGVETTLYTRDPEKARIIAAEGLTAYGSLAGTWHPGVSCDLAEAVRDADYILVMTLANAHRAVAEALRPILSEGQTVIVFNSNWGALEFVQVLGEDAERKNLTVAETAAQLFIAASPMPGRVRLSLKNKVGLAAADPEKTEPLCAALHEIFPQFEPVGSIIQSTMGTTNPVIHVPVTICNAARVENGQPFLFYVEGASHAAIDLVLQLDRERIAVAKALGCEIEDVLTGINSFWPTKYDNLFDALTKNPAYQQTMGPGKLDHRYITEDVPYGIAPIAQIGRLFGVPTPATDVLLAYLHCILPERLLQSTLTFTREDFAK